MDLITAIDLLTKFGALFTMAVAIWGGKQEWYLWRGSHDKIVKAIEEGHAESMLNMKGSQTSYAESLLREIKELKEDRNYWRDNAVETLTAARRALKLADRESE